MTGWQLPKPVGISNQSFIAPDKPYGQPVADNGYENHVQPPPVFEVAGVLFGHPVGKPHGTNHHAGQQHRIQGTQFYLEHPVVVTPDLHDADSNGSNADHGCDGVRHVEESITIQIIKWCKRTGYVFGAYPYRLNERYHQSKNSKYEKYGLSSLPHREVHVTCLKTTNLISAEAG